MKSRLLLAALALCSCASAQPAPATPAKSADHAAPASADDDATATDRDPSRPLDPPPPALSASEQGELSGACALLLTPMVEGDADGARALDDALSKGEKAADAEAKAVAIAVDKLKQAVSADQANCVVLFEKQERRKLFERDPAEAEARGVVDSCVKRVEAAYGKSTMTFDEGGAGRAQQGPFCPDDLPVPPKLSLLPYRSTKDDWDAPAWKCLQFGLRGRQNVQFEYAAPAGGAEFTCTARYLPRHGGPAVEIFRGGKQGEGGRLVLQAKTMKRRMKGR